MIVLRGYGGSYLVTEGYGWEAAANILSGIPKVILSHDTWKVVHDTFIPKFVHGGVVPKIVLDNPTAKAVHQEAIASKSVHEEGRAGKVVMDYFAPKVVVDSSAGGKVVMDSRVTKVVMDSLREYRINHEPSRVRKIVM